MKGTIKGDSRNKRRIFRVKGHGPGSGSSYPWS
jgi:hypothetical protein